MSSCTQPMFLTTPYYFISSLKHKTRCGDRMSEIFSRRHNFIYTAKLQKTPWNHHKSFFMWIVAYITSLLKPNDSLTVLYCMWGTHYKCKNQLCLVSSMSNLAQSIKRCNFWLSHRSKRDLRAQAERKIIGHYA